jgi:tetratricopeptide (TPR) repeat protein
LAVLLLVVAGAVVYANSLSIPPVVDDHQTIFENPQIRSLWTPDVLMPARELPVAGRPLVNVSLAVNYALGGTNPVGYHLFNLVIHLACGLLLFALLRRALALPNAAAALTEHATAIASATALLWLVHPLTSEAVDYITQRSESMYALLLLLTLYASVRGLERAAWGWRALAVCACILGAGVKESIVIAPLLVALFDRLFVFPSWRSAFAQRWRFYAGLGISWLLLAAIQTTGPRLRSAGFNSGVGVWDYLLNQCQMIARYLWLTVWPGPLVVFYGPPATLTAADVWPYGLVVLVMLAATVIALRERPVIGYLGAWFFVSLAPTSSILPIATEVGAERRMYVPLMALLAGVVMLAAWLIAQRTAIVRRTAYALLVAIAVALAARTIVRNGEYADPLRLARLTLDRWPAASSELMLGEQLWAADRRDEALPHLRAAAAGWPRAHYSLGVALINRGDVDEGIRELRTFIDVEPLLVEVPAAHVALARALARRNEWSAAAAEARQAVAKAPFDADANGVLADTLFHQENVADAVPAYQRYLQLRPDDTAALMNLGILLASSNRLNDAVAAFSRAVQLQPSDGPARRNLATALLDANRVDEAAAAAREAVRLLPQDAVAYDLLGQSLARQGRRVEATAAFQRALALDPANTSARDHLVQIGGAR